MGLHGNAKLGPAGRRAMVMLVVCDGVSRREAARRHGVCKTTAKRWVDRYWAAGQEERAAGACFVDRSSRPHSSPRQLPAAEAARICAARLRTGWGPRLIAGATDHPHATVWRCLRRADLSRLPPARLRRGERLCRGRFRLPDRWYRGSIDTERKSRSRSR